MVELAVDVEGDDSHGEDGDRKFDEFILRLKKEADLITFDAILTKNDQMKACIEKAKFLSRLPNPTLLCGETGTGEGTVYTGHDHLQRSAEKEGGYPELRHCAGKPDGNHPFWYGQRRLHRRGE